MAKKNLSRSVLEAGRSAGFKSESRETTRSERTELRAFLGRVRCDLDYYDESVVPCRMPIRRYDLPDGKFAPDKLSAAYRWLESRIGEPWDTTYGELRKMFDTRTTPGRHIVFDHLIPEVRPRYYDSYTRYKVDESGILRKNQNRRKFGSGFLSPTITEDEFRAWLANRMIGRRGRYLFWFVLADADLYAYRQDRRLNDAERAFFYDKLTPFQRAEILKNAPTVRPFRTIVQENREIQRSIFIAHPPT